MGSQTKKLAQRLATARESAGLTQAQVAEKLEIPRPSISNIESGKRRVSSEELAAFAELYRVNIDWLLARTESLPREEEIQFAARELSKLDDEDLNRVIEILRMVRLSGGGDENG